MQEFLNFEEYKRYSLNKQKAKYAVITGGCGRVGSIFTSELLALGVKIICLSRSKKNFNEYSKKLPKEISKNLVWHSLDLTKPKTIDKSLKFINKNFPKLDILIINAAQSNRGKNFKYTAKSLGKELWGTFAGSFYLTEKILPKMRKNDSAKVIVTGSLWGAMSPNFKTYLDMDIGPSPIIASGKAGIMQYVKYLASREASNNITANALLPGWFPRKGKKQRNDYIKSINSKIPLNRIGKLEDLIPAVKFLISDKNTYMTGQFLIVDGGYSIW